MDNLVDALVKEMDHNGDGNLDIDEVRDGLLGQFAGPGKYNMFLEGYPLEAKTAQKNWN